MRTISNKTVKDVATKFIQNNIHVFTVEDKNVELKIRKLKSVKSKKTLWQTIKNYFKKENIIVDLGDGYYLEVEKNRIQELAHIDPKSGIKLDEIEREVLIIDTNKTEMKFGSTIKFNTKTKQESEALRSA